MAIVAGCVVKKMFTNFRKQSPLHDKCLSDISFLKTAFNCECLLDFWWPAYRLCFQLAYSVTTAGVTYSLRQSSAKSVSRLNGYWSDDDRTDLNETMLKNHVIWILSRGNSCCRLCVAAYVELRCGMTSKQALTEIAMIKAECRKAIRKKAAQATQKWLPRL